MVLDILVAALLACTIGYAFLLNRRLLELRKDKEKLERLAESFSDATQRAEQSVAKLRVAAEDVVNELRQGISDAEVLKGDLDLLLERGETTADKLENGVRGASNKGSVETRSEANSMKRPMRQAVPGGVEPGEGLREAVSQTLEQQLAGPSASRSAAARDLMDALRAAR